MIGLETGVALGLLGGFLALDRTAFLQCMVSRPLVASTLAGVLLGEMHLGMRCGLLLELLWLMDPPVGASVPPDESLAAVLSATYASLTPAGWALPARAALGILLGLPFGYLGRWVDVRVRRANGRLIARAREGREGSSLGRLQRIGAVRFFVAGAAAAVAGAFAGAPLVAHLAMAVPPKVVAALEWSGGLLPVVGVAAVLAALPGRTNRALFGAGVLGGLVLPRLLAVPWPGRGPWAR
ncbi:MAG: PTS sugar transporter subunit IIC [Deltaproteobacteria bacterium]|nr:PTS sugar transporter subunit IIC [Deltaproteobacteria bacterium]